MNKLILTGRITKDPEIRQTQNGNAAVSFCLAVDRGSKDAQGNRQADFINCTCWKGQAEYMGKYVKKGALLLVEGHLSTRNYTGADGQQKYVTDVVCSSIENLSPRQDKTAQNVQGGQVAQGVQNVQQGNYARGQQQVAQPQPQQYQQYQQNVVMPNYQQQPQGGFTTQPVQQGMQDYPQPTYQFEDDDLPF